MDDIQKDEALTAGITQYQTQYFAWLLSRQIEGGSTDKLAQKATEVPAQPDFFADASGGGVG
jgi:hypothetical protein